MTATIMAKTQLLIGGAWRDAEAGATYEDANPATGGALADVAEAGRSDVDAAVAAARKAFDAGKWSGMAASRRAKIVYKMAQLIGELAERLRRRCKAHSDQPGGESPASMGYTQHRG